MPQSRIEESLEWLTAIRRCRTAEQREALRLVPRQEFILNYVMTERQFSLALSIAKSLTEPRVLLPMWTDFLVCPPLLIGDTTITIDTALTDITALSYVIVWDSPTSYEVHQVELNSLGVLTLVSPIIANRPSAVLAPIREADFAQEFEAERGAHSTIKATARFRLTDVPYLGGLANFGYPSYKGFPVVTSRSIVKTTLSELFTREYSEIDPGVGLPARIPLIARPKQDSEITWSVLNRADRRKLFAWLHSRKGQCKAFFSPTWNNDFTLVGNIGAADTTITVSDSNVRNTALFPFDVMLRTLSGVNYCVRVISAALNEGTGNEVLTVESSLGTAVNYSAVETFARLIKYRFASDRIDVFHGMDGAAKASAPLVEVPL
jgi:hypothetical protein